METELKDLIGKKVNKVYINEIYLRFDTDGGIFTYEVEGDCCSSSYFYDFFGLDNLIKNGIIKEIKEVELHPYDILKTNWGMKDSKHEDSDIEVYGFQITTECKDYGDVTSVFSFRNSSNGYYGGSINKSNFKEELPELIKD